MASELVLFPSYSRLSQAAAAMVWPAKPNVEISQTTVPKDNHLRKRLGIQPEDRLDVFAGMGGNWARSLKAERYSDLSASMTQRAAAHKKADLVRSYRVKNAMSIPERPQRFDWAFSFEPIPLWDNALSLAALRSLWANRKGLKIVNVDKLEGLTQKFNEHCSELFSRMANEYGADYKVAQVNILSVYPTRSKKTFYCPHVVHTLESTPEARKKAELDLHVLSWLNRIPDSSTVELKQLHADLARRRNLKGLSVYQVVQSLRRIHALSDFIKNPLLGSVRLNSN